MSGIIIGVLAWGVLLVIILASWEREKRSFKHDEDDASDAFDLDAELPETRVVCPIRPRANSSVHTVRTRPIIT